MRHESWFKFFVGATILWGLVCAGAAVGAIYVVCHFLAKVW
jgi:hypothetical protein